MSAPIAILQIHERFDGGGKDARMVRLMNHWGGRARHDLLLLDRGADGARAGLDPAVAARFLDGPDFGLQGGPGRYMALAQLMRDYDLVLSFGWGGFDGVIAQRLLGLLMGLPPIIHHEDGRELDVTGPLGLSGDFYRRSALPSARALVVTTPRVAHIAINRWHEAAAHVHQIPDGFPVAAFAGRRPASAIPGLSKDGRLLLGARIEDASAAMVDQLFRAVAPLGDTARLVLLDAPAEGAMLRARAAALGIADLLVPECLPPTCDYLGALDLFVLLALGAPEPIDLAQAMAAGLPVVASDTGDARDMLPGPGRPYLVRPGDGDALVTALAALAGDAALRMRLGEANRARAQQCFDETLMFDLYGKLYGSALGRPDALL
jgi:hypothetical protein